MQIAKPSTRWRSVAVERSVERENMKIEEEKSEAKSAKKEKKEKKEKKHKTGQTNLPENKNCTVDSESLTDVKRKKKKDKKVDKIVLDIKDECLDGGGKKEEKKKKKKREIVTESLDNANGSDVNEKEVSKKKKKKKKKQLADDENQEETAQSLVKEEEDVEKKQQKEKKVKNKSLQIQPEYVKMEKEEEEEQKPGKDKLSKKAKKRKHILVVSTDETEERVQEKKKKKKKTTDEETHEAVDGMSVTKKKNKAKTNETENEVKLEPTEGETGEAEEVTVQEKRDGNEVGPPKTKVKNKHSKADKDNVLNKKKDKSKKSEIDIIEEGDTGLKKKGKKEKGRSASVEVSEVEETEPKKKKNKKEKSKGEDREPLSLQCEEVEETSKKSKRKSSIRGETKSLQNGAKKKIKEELEDQHESSQMDVVFLSEKSGNTDEVTINQERRQALQMEIDQASQPQKAAKPAGFGQWSTAQFDSSDQQQKFLRLMGGFKKGFQPAARSTGGANMALGMDAQQQLQRGLLGEFERAQSRRVDFSNRGAGLGFTAPSNKKFAIDISACRSVRFDD